MDSATINLTALAETRAKMIHPRPTCMTASQNNHAGIVAEHNAIGVLIEVARTLIVYNAAKKEAARCRMLWSRDWNNFALQTASSVADQVSWKGKTEHDAALAKVSL